MNYIDIHTHHSSRPHSLRNYNFQEPFQDNLIYSVGLHPWDLKDTIENDLNMIKVSELAIKPNVIAIGETGVDRVIDMAIGEQKRVFMFHLHLAIKLNKPLIVHCVRAYSDFLEIFKKEKLSVPVIFHDYQGNFEEVRKLMQYPCYFSFGQSLFHSEKVMNVLKLLPEDRFFLETDDQETFSIDMIYQKAGEILQKSPFTLLLQMTKNSQRLFNWPI